MKGLIFLHEERSGQGCLNQENLEHAYDEATRLYLQVLSCYVISSADNVLVLAMPFLMNAGDLAFKPVGVVDSHELCAE